MSYDRTIRRRETALDAGVRRALRGERPDDDSGIPDEWSLEKLERIEKERKRLEDEREAGAWY